MVLPAVLRDLALDPEQAAWRCRAIRVDRGSVFLAVARQLEGEVGDLPAALSAVLLDLRCGLHRAWLPGRAAAGRNLRRRGPHPDRVVLHSFPDHPAVDRPARNAAAGPQLHLGGGAPE